MCNPSKTKCSICNLLKVILKRHVISCHTNGKPTIVRINVLIEHAKPSLKRPGMTGRRTGQKLKERIVFRKKQNHHQKNEVYKKKKKKKLLKCEFCSKSYTSKLSFEKHIKQHKKASAKSMLKPVLDNRVLTRRVSRTGRESIVIEEIDQDNEEVADLNRQIIQNVENGQIVFNCPKCSLMADTRETIDKHYRLVHGCGHDEQMCLLCEQSFSTFESLKEHMRQHVQNATEPLISEIPEEEKIPKTCELCTYRPASKADYKRHVKMHHKRQPRSCADYYCQPATNAATHVKLYQCIATNCEYVSRFRSNVKRHYSKTHMNENYACEFCAKKFSMGVEYGSHLLSHASQYRRSTIVRQSLPPTIIQNSKALMEDEAQAEDHQTSVQLPTPLDRHPHDLSAKTSADLLHDVAALNRAPVASAELPDDIMQPEATEYDITKSTAAVDEETREFQCYFCRETSRGLTALATHLNQHLKDHTHLCDICAQTFISKKQLQEHVRRHSYNLNCSFCEKIFNSPSHLRKHEMTHTGEKPNTCQHCGKQFACKSNLTSHVRIHTGEKPYACKLCDYRANQSSSLKKHMIASHGDVRAFPCSVCPKKFKFKSTLTQHMKRHEGVRNYPCNKCDARFVTPSELRDHVLVHTNERRYACKQCERTFKRSDTLKTHMKVHYKAAKASSIAPVSKQTQGLHCQQVSVHSHVAASREPKQGVLSEEPFPVPAADLNQILQWSSSLVSALHASSS